MLELLVVAVFLQSVALVVGAVLLSVACVRLMRVADRLDRQERAAADMRKDMDTMDQVLLELGKAVYGK